MVSPAPNTLQDVKNTVRRITASPDPSQLSEAELETYINGFYSQEMPAAVKTDQLRTVFELFTAPNVDQYTVDVNTYQDFHQPLYVNGRQGNLFKDRQAFFNRWTRQSVKEVAATGDGTVGPYNFTLSNIPFLRNSLVIGTLDTGSGVVKVEDDGAGNLIEAGTSTNVGTVNYVTGVTSFAPTQAILSGQDINVWVSHYSASYPADVLFWNNELTVRPVPDDVYRIEIEAILTPTAFAANSSQPLVDQWWQFIALGAATKILRDRQDMAGLANITPLLEEQRGLVLERQANNEIGQQNITIYNGGFDNAPYGNGYWT